MFYEHSMTESFEQILELIKKTGDRCVIIDRATQNNYVVMSIKDYERLALSIGNTSHTESAAAAPIKEEAPQKALPLGGVPIEEESESSKPDWWEEEAEKPKALEEKQADDQYYLEPVES